MRNLTYILFLFCSSLIAQVYPPAINLDDFESINYVEPTNVPEYLVPFVNEQGMTVTRVADLDEFGTNSQRLGHNYSKDMTFNSDGSLIKLSGYPAAILDGETFEFLFWSSIPSYGRWSNTEPEYIYGTSGDSFVRHNVYTNERFVIKTFTEFQSVDFGYGEGNQDRSDRFVGLIGDGNTFIVYDIWDNSYVTAPIPAGNLDWFSVSPLGTYAIAMYAPNGSGVNEGIKRYDIDLTNLVHIADNTEHGDLGLLLDNTEVLVQAGGQEQWDNNHYIEMITLSTGQSTDLFRWSSSVHGHSGIWGMHISVQDRKGVAYISENCCETHPTFPNGLFALHLDGSNKVEYFGFHHTDRNANTNGNHSAMIVPNRDGTKIMFKSNWHNPEWESLNSGYAFVLEVPQEVLNVPTFEESEVLLEAHYWTFLGQPILSITDIQQLKYYRPEDYLPQGIYIVEHVYETRSESNLIPIKQ